MAEITCLIMTLVSVSVHPDWFCTFNWCNYATIITCISHSDTCHYVTPVTWAMVTLDSWWRIHLGRLTAPLSTCVQ